MQVGIIFLIVMTSLVNLTSSTDASFNDTEKVSGNITIGTWEVVEPDMNALKFIRQSGNCEEIAAVIRNDNDSGTIEESLKYEVYQLENDTSKKTLKVASGDIPQLKPGEEKALTFNTVESGRYKFKVFQHSGKGELWSEPISVTCKDPSVEKAKVEPATEDKQTTTEKDHKSMNSGQAQETKKDKTTSANNQEVIAEKEDEQDEKDQKKLNGTDVDKK